jgi:GT2 family glycosyltransferase
MHPKVSSRECGVSVDHMFDVSIIIVSWNAKQYLLNCLNSLIDTADGYSQEIIVVDNASSDGSAEMVEKDFPQVKLIRNEENLGFAKANNIGIKESTGRYVCLINSDVVVLDNCVKRMIEFMDNHLKAGMAGPKVLNPDRTLQVSCRHFPSIWNNLCQAIGLNKVFPKSVFFSEPFMNYWSHDSVRSIDVLTGCFWMVRRKSLDDVGLLDESFFFYGEDIDWCKRFQKAGWDVMFNPDAQAIHFGGASSANAPIRFYIELQKADLHYWEKHYGSIGRACYAMIILLRHLLRIVAMAFHFIIFPSKRKEASFKLKRSLVCIRCVLFNKSDMSRL